VIIDSIDDLERTAANALLKTLEEPPAGTIFLLVSHAAGRLLPTIRSRCCLLRFAPLDDATMTSFVLANMPGNDPSDRTHIIAAAKGLPGAALKAASLDMASVEEVLRTLATKGDPTNAIRFALGKSLSAKASQKRYEAFLLRAPQFIAATARERNGDALAEALATWDEAKDLAQNAVQASLDPQTVIFALASHIAALAPQGSIAKA
jgi:DNA polymerase III subunit delta'